MFKQTIVLQHKIIPTGKLDKPFQLVVWEPARVEGNRALPFHFTANYFCDSRQEARDILEQIEQNSGNSPECPQAAREEQWWGNRESDSNPWAGKDQLTPCLGLSN